MGVRHSQHPWSNPVVRDELAEADACANAGPERESVGVLPPRRTAADTQRARNRVSTFRVMRDTPASTMSDAGQTMEPTEKTAPPLGVSW